MYIVYGCDGSRNHGYDGESEFDSDYSLGYSTESYYTTSTESETESDSSSSIDSDSNNWEYKDYESSDDYQFYTPAETELSKRNLRLRNVRVLKWNTNFFDEKQVWLLCLVFKSGLSFIVYFIILFVVFCVCTGIRYCSY